MDILKNCRSAKFLLLLLLTTLLGCASTKGPRPQTAGDKGPPAALQEFWKNPDGLLQEAKKAYDAGDSDLATTALNRILNTYPKSDADGEAQKLLTEIQIRTGSDRFKIGVLLPLTGSFARFGEASLDGIGCAVGLFDPCGSPASKVQVVVFDTKGDPARAALGAKELIEKEKVSAVIGPLLSVDFSEAASTAQQLQTPMILLAPQEGATQKGDFIFQHALMPQEEVDALVEKINGLGMKKFVVFYPTNRYGEQYKSLFLITLQSKGAGKIIQATSYSPDIPDFLGIVEQAMQNPAVDKMIQSNGASKLGIFIPDAYKQASEIAQSLDALSIKGPKLIGTSRWYHPQLLETSAQSLEGAVLDTLFFAEGPRESTHQFSETFFKAYGSQPAWLEAFGFDATRLILYAYANRKGETGIAMRDALLTIQNFPSVVGPLSWNGSRISQWPLDFITVENGKFVPLAK